METNEKLLSAIFNIGRLIKEKINLSGCLNDFTYSEFEVLKFIQNKKNITMKSISDHLHIKPPSVTPVIDSLIKKGILSRIQSTGDRRVIYINLTAKGEKSLQKKYKNIHKIIGEIFGKLNEKDKRKLIKLFEKIHEKNI
jgi:MarR family 2-MHQ and catechol resistance regulon transcriptional repressor